LGDIREVQKVISRDARLTPQRTLLEDMGEKGAEDEAAWRRKHQGAKSRKETKKGGKKTGQIREISQLKFNSTRNRPN